MPCLLERDVELAGIAAAIAAARGGTGRAVIVEGIAGVGKTALLNAAIEQGRREGMRVLVARATELETAFAWGVMRQLFDPFAMSLTLEERRELFSSGPSELAAIVLGGAEYPTPDHDSPFAVVHALYWLAVTASRPGPLLLVVDDLQWADAPSLRALAFLINRLEALPIAVVMSTRTRDPGAQEPRQLLAGIFGEPGVERLAPAALSPAASSHLVRRGLGPQIADEVCLACHESTGGNPFLLLNLVDALHLDDAEATPERIRATTPERVTRSVWARLERLPAEARELARAAAILGARPGLRTIMALAALEDHAVRPAAEALIDAGIVQDEPGIAFVHPIVRSAVLEGMSALQRDRCHRRAAELLAHRRDSAEEAGVHLLATAPSGDDWVVATLRAAARSARDRAAHDSAVAYLRRALEEPPASCERAVVLLELGLAEAAEDPASACEHLGRALALTPAGTARARAGLALSRAAALCGRFAEAAGVLEHVMAEADGSELEATLQAEFLNCARWDLSTRPQTFPVLERLARRAEQDRPLDPRLHAQLAIESAVAGGDPGFALDHARQALAGLPVMAPESSVTLPQVISVLLLADLVDEARQAADAWLQTAQQRGWPLITAIAANTRALVAMQAGAISDAISYARLSLDLGAHVWIPPFAVAFLIEPLIARGDTATALAELGERGLDGELPDAWPFVVLRFVRGRLHTSAGDHSRAVRELQRTGELCEAWGVRSPAFVWWRSSASESLLALGRRDEALALAREELALAEPIGTARTAGVALRAIGNAQEDGLETLAASVEALEHSQAPLELARSLIDYGAALRRGGKRSQARGPLSRGLDVAHGLGALGLVERARDELVVAGARPRRNAMRGRDALTASELRVARMAARGMSNREIAQALFVTLRTVELHLTSSYDKLGISSRGQLCAVLD